MMNKRIRIEPVAIIPSSEVLDADIEVFVQELTDRSDGLASAFRQWPSLQRSAVRLAELVGINLISHDGRPVVEALLLAAADELMKHQYGHTKGYCSFVHAILGNVEWLFAQTVWGSTGDDDDGWITFELISEPLRDWIRRSKIILLTVMPSSLDHHPIAHFTVQGKKVGREAVLSSARAMLQERILSYRDEFVLMAGGSSDALPARA